MRSFNLTQLEFVNCEYKQITESEYEHKNMTEKVTLLPKDQILQNYGLVENTGANKWQYDFVI